VSDPLPRARLVSRAVASSNPGRAIHAVDIATTAVVSEPLPLEDGPAGTVSMAQDRPGWIRVGAIAPARQLLVVSESWHEGWRVTVDGEARPLVRVYGDFIGAVVEAGAHEVEVRFRPRSLEWGKRLSALGLGLIVLLFVVALLRGRGRGAGP
jgi:hypothetical protein